MYLGAYKLLFFGSAAFSEFHFAGECAFPKCVHFPFFEAGGTSTFPNGASFLVFEWASVTLHGSSPGKVGHYLFLFPIAFVEGTRGSASASFDPVGSRDHVPMTWGVSGAVLSQRPMGSSLGKASSGDQSVSHSFEGAKENFLFFNPVVFGVKSSSVAPFFEEGQWGSQDRLDFQFARTSMCPFSVEFVARPQAGSTSAIMGSAFSSFPLGCSSGLIGSVPWLAVIFSR